MRIKIERLVHRGLGLGKFSGKTIFVPGVIPGEIAECEIETEKASYAVGRMTKLIQPSPFRTQPACRHFPACGGCQLMHIDYQHQLDLKTQVLVETIRRIAKLDPSPLLKEPAPAPSALRYRSRVRFHISAGEIGFKPFQARGFVRIDDCLLARDELRAAIPALRKLVREINLGKDYEVELDVEPETKKVFALISARRKDFYILENQAFVKAKLLPKELLRLLSFVQVNPEQNKKMVELAAGLAESVQAKTALELFPGSGNFSFAIAEKVNRLVAVEFNRNAVELANIKKRERKADNIEFISQAADSYLNYAVKSRLQFDLVVLDPPRTGAKKEVERMVRIPPDSIVYVSCEPATLARDLKILAAAGYRIEKIIPIDMFPQTFHLETITLLHKT